VHSDARSAETTDWRQILRLYDQLLTVAPGPVVALHRAVALAEVEGPGPALQPVDALDLTSYHVYHAVRTDLLRRLNRRPEAATACGEAIAHTQNETERTFLLRRRQELAPD
jgi:RNA polymerase sigma-70 factor (ECF subfamily)